MLHKRDGEGGLILNAAGPVTFAWGENHGSDGWKWEQPTFEAGIDERGGLVFQVKYLEGKCQRRMKRTRQAALRG